MNWKKAFILSVLFLSMFVGCSDGQRKGKIRFYDPFDMILGWISFSVEAKTTSPLPPLSQGEVDVFGGTFTLKALLGPVTFNSLVLTQYGTVQPGQVRKVRLFVDDGDGIWEPDQDTVQFGTEVAFFPPNNKISFASSLNVSETQNSYIHVVYTLGLFATGNVGIQINSLKDIGADTFGTGTFPLSLPLITIQAPAPTWQFLNPLPASNIKAIFSPVKGSFFVAGKEGLIARSDGTGWKRLDVGVTTDLLALWGTSEKNMYAVGVGGVILHFDGKTWSKLNSGLPSPPAIDLYSVFGNSATDIFIVGKSGTVLHSIDGTTWSPQTSGTAEDLNGVYGFAANDVFAAGDKGTLVRYNGTSWSTITLNPTTTSNFNSIWGSSPSDVFAVGNGFGTGSDFMYHFDGTSWTVQTVPSANELYAIEGRNSTEIYAVGKDGIILRYNGTGWALENESGLSTTHALSDLTFSDQDVYAAGEQGRILKRSPSPWASVPSGTSQNLNSIYAFDQQNVFSVGNGGTILYYNGTAILSQTSGTTANLHSVWGNSPSDVFAVGEQNTILHFDGTTWTPFNTLPVSGISFRGVWGYGPHQVLAVGSGGTILFYNGSTWTLKASNTVSDLYGLWGTPVNSSGVFHVFAVGDGGTIRRSTNKGVTWSLSTSGTANNLRCIHGYSESFVYTGGESGTVLYFDGTNWAGRNNQIAPGVTIHSLFVNRPRDVYLGGTGGLISRLDPTSLNWITQSSSSGSAILSLAGVTWTDYNTNSTSYEGNLLFASGSGGFVGLGPGWRVDQFSGLATQHDFVRDDRGRALWAFSNGEAFGCTEKGNVLHFKNGKTTRYLLGIPLRAVWGSSPTNVFAVGKGGNIFHFDGTSFVSQTSNTTNDLSDVYGTSSGSHVFVVGNSGTIRMSTNSGGTWVTPTSVPAGAGHLYYIGGTSEINMFAVGSSGTILKTVDGGANWTDQSVGGTKAFYAIFSISANDHVACGSSGLLYRTTDGGATPWVDQNPGSVLTSTVLRNVWGDSPSNIFVVGSSGTILHFNGTWSPQASGISDPIRGLIGFGSEVFACASGGVVLYTTDGGVTWTRQETGTHYTLYWLHGTSPTNLFMVGSLGTLMRRN